MSQGGSLLITVTADRLDGFNGKIEVWMEGLPTGFSATSGTILPDETSVTLALSAAPDATTPGRQIPSPIRAVGRAQIGEVERAASPLSSEVERAANPLSSPKEIIRTVEPENGVRLITVLPKPDIRVTTDVSSVTIQPGCTAVVEVNVERQNGFGGRVPIDVRNLPFGVRVLDVGLNGVLVTEQGNSRQFVLYAEPWVKPMTRPFYCVGRVESNPPTENASTPIMLTVGKGESASALSAKQAPEY